jgi:predicted phosphodiesterase
MLDRFGVSVLAIGLLVLFLVLQQWVAVFVLGVVFALLHVELARGRPSVDPAQLMAARASDLVRLFPASFVVMGHTHVPDTRELGGAATYVNLGSWAEGKPEESEKTPYRAARTHLVVHDHVDRHEAELRAWRDGRPEAVHALVRPLAD